MYDAYVGWFSGAVEELFPLGPTERAAKMLEYLGEEAVSGRGGEGRGSGSGEGVRRWGGG